LRILRLICYFFAVVAILILSGDIISRILPRGDLKQNIELGISLIEYISADIIYTKGFYLIWFGTIFILIMLFSNEGETIKKE